MQIKVSYVREHTSKGFHANFRLLVPTSDGIGVRKPFSDPEAWETEVEAEKKAWLLAVAWRNQEMPHAEISDNKGRREPGIPE
jgi:hypothetical protein